jgi:hypothetical protein
MLGVNIKTNECKTDDSVAVMEWKSASSYYKLELSLITKLNYGVAMLIRLISSRSSARIYRMDASVICFL